MHSVLPEVHSRLHAVGVPDAGQGQDWLRREGGTRQWEEESGLDERPEPEPHLRFPHGANAGWRSGLRSLASSSTLLHLGAADPVHPDEASAHLRAEEAVWSRLGDDPNSAVPVRADGDA